MVYDPQEDSFLLKEFVKRYAEGNVLDMGTGSGIQAIEASHSKASKKVFGVDIDPKALAYAKKYNDPKRHRKVTWIKSDLFKNLKKYQNYFDTIIFNAPYLPQEHKLRDIQLEGGRRGNEVIERFMKDVVNYLKTNGHILLVFSSLTPEVDKIINENLFVGKELGKKHMFFEDIFVFLIKKAPILKQLEKRGVSNIKYFNKGKRGLIYTGIFKKKKVAIKIKRPESKAENTISKEGKMIKILNKHSIGPNYQFHTSKFLVYDFIDGKMLKDLSLKEKRRVSKKVLDQCFKLDKLKIDKEEMTRPLKHVIVKGKKVTMIDFERAHKVKEPHNVTQFTQYTGNHADRKNKKKWIAIAKEYRKSPSKKLLQKMKVMLNG